MADSLLERPKLRTNRNRLGNFLEEHATTSKDNLVKGGLTQYSAANNCQIHEVLTFLCDCGIHMTMDQSLRVQAGAIKTRNVLTRAERVARLQQLDKFDEEASVVGMPKVRVVKVSLKRKKKVKKADDDKK